MKQEIKKRVKITDFIESDGLLDIGDKKWKCLSPFSDEKTPSFFITELDDGTQIFYCHSTQKGGDIFSFLQEKENKSFQEIYFKYINELGLSTEKPKKYKDSNFKYIQFCSDLTNELHKQLGFYPDIKKYLITDRGLTEDILNELNIGFCPKGFLNNFIKTGQDYRNYAIDLSLIKENDWEYIGNRIIFPLYTKDGHCIGINSRSIDDSQPKYLNPNNNPIFKKNEFLYGLNFAKNQIKEKDKVIIVEGCLDQIKLYYNGFENVVSPLGKSLLSGQVKAIKQYTNNIIFCFDGDKAGKGAIFKNFKDVIKQDCNIFIAELPDNEDPDSFIMTYGKLEFQKILDNSLDILSYLNKIHGEELIEMLEELSNIINKIDDSIKKQIWIQNIKKYTGIDIRKDNIKKEYFLLEDDRGALSYKDNLFLKLYLNAENEECKTLLDDNLFFDTEFGKTLYLKLSNKTYSISFTDKENEAISNLILEKKYSEEEISKEINRIKEQNF